MLQGFLGSSLNISGPFLGPSWDLWGHFQEDEVKEEAEEDGEKKKKEEDEDEEDSGRGGKGEGHV